MRDDNEAISLTALYLYKLVIYTSGTHYNAHTSILDRLHDMQHRRRLGLAVVDFIQRVMTNDS